MRPTVGDNHSIESGSTRPNSLVCTLAMISHSGGAGHCGHLPPTQQQNNKYVFDKPAQHEYQDIWSNFRFLLGKHVFVSYQKSRFFAEANPQYHYKSIRRYLLLLTRGRRPHIHLLQGPNMKSHFYNSRIQFRVACDPHPHIAGHAQPHLRPVRNFYIIIVCGSSLNSAH
jgi:hypothetical protein